MSAGQVGNAIGQFLGLILIAAIWLIVARLVPPLRRRPGVSNGVAAALVCLAAFAGAEGGRVGLAFVASTILTLIILWRNYRREILAIAASGGNAQTYVATKRGTIIIAIAGAIVITLLLSRVLELTIEANTAASNIYDQLAATVAQLNREAPKALDPDTRFDEAFAGPGLLITYRFTLPKLVSTNIPPGNFDATLVPTVRKSDCVSPAIKAFFAHNIDVRYVYRGSDGLTIGTMMLTPTLCAAH